MHCLSVFAESPRTTSTYLYDKTDEVHAGSSNYDNNTESAPAPAPGGITQAELRERAKQYTKPVEPYCTVELRPGEKDKQLWHVSIETVFLFIGNSQ